MFALLIHPLALPHPSALSLLTLWWIAAQEVTLDVSFPSSSVLSEGEVTRGGVSCIKAHLESDEGTCNVITVEDGESNSTKGPTKRRDDAKIREIEFSLNYCGGIILGPPTASPPPPPPKKRRDVQTQCNSHYLFLHLLLFQQERHN